MKKFWLINIIGITGLAFVLCVFVSKQGMSSQIKGTSDSIQESSCLNKQQFKLYSVPETVYECVVVKNYQHCSKSGFFVISAQFSVLLVEESQVIVKDHCNGAIISDDEVTTQKLQDIGPFGTSKCINSDLETAIDTDDPIKIAMDQCEVKRKVYLEQLDKSFQKTVL